MAEPLFAFQNVGSHFLSDRRQAILADPMGLGKSAQVVVAMDILGVETGLIMAPAGFCYGWKREFKKFSDRKREIVMLFDGAKPRKYCINIASYEGATRMHWEKLMTMDFDAMVPDEFHRLKNIEAQRTQAFYGFKGAPGLAHRAQHVWPLSGTPAPNNPFELYLPARCLFPSSFKNSKGSVMNRFEFMNRYCTLKNNGFGNKITGGKNLAELRERLAPHVLRRKKRDVLKDLPPLRQTELYIDAHDELKNLQTTEELDMMLDLNRSLLAADPEEKKLILNSIDDSVARRLRRLLGLAKVPALTEWLLERFEDSNEKILIYGWHTEVLETIAHALRKVTKVAYVDGRVPPRKRTEQEELFQNDPDCGAFVGQIIAAGEALTLTAASEILFAEYSWVPKDNDQVIGRIERIGQKNSMLVRYAVVPDSLDETIAAVVTRKRSVTSQIFD